MGEKKTSKTFFLQIVASICEFVESNGVDIRSGWRPLFGALKHITFSDAVLDEIIPANSVNNNNVSSSNPASPSRAVQEPKETRLGHGFL